MPLLQAVLSDQEQEDSSEEDPDASNYVGLLNELMTKVVHSVLLVQGEEEVLAFLAKVIPPV